MQRLRLLILACALGAAAACGGSSDEGEPVTTATATATAPAQSSASPEPAASATAPPLEPTASTGALAIEQLPLIGFVRANGTVVELAVEVPPREEYGIGLSGRYELGERGMLFHYPDALVARSFYMKNTHIDLDIAFLGADLEVQEILTMEAESLEIRRPAEAFQYAVEAPAGWYAENEVQVGDRARFAFELAELRP